MTCKGNNLWDDLQQWGGICPNKRSDDGQTGCLFDGHVYQKMDKIVFGGCLGEMTCLGHSLYTSITPLFGDCSKTMTRRSEDGQSGCWFDGRVYSTREEILIRPCLGKMTCLGENNLSNITPLYGICEAKRTVNGQDGCLYDGMVLKAGETITIQGTTTELMCLGHNLYKEFIH
ncbi:uncharacterized protein LOC133190924 [Saccostrea echinata]|uniref:uncharacterized protein LOC133190924 n=1 Tax=Saccostrea echinata TaxID=191078 RepID=UPI002A8374CB|nr:uncharacterized protein LOC133190924 [Saccostrea echinata]